MNSKYQLELWIWFFIVLLCCIIVGPILIKCGSNYPFYIKNIISIIIFLVFTKFLFLWHVAPYAKNRWVKFFFIFFPIVLMLHQVDSLYDFQRFVDESGVFTFVQDSDNLSDYNFAKFIKYQFIFFTVGSIITIALVPIRMIISFWRIHNTKDGI